jgi:hypothetical protein
MNTRPWLSLMATVLHGPRFVAARPSTTSEHAWTTWQPTPTPTPAPAPAPTLASRTVDIQFNGVGPTELWSSVATRAIHRVEEVVIVLIMLHFAVGMLGILFGW